MNRKKVLFILISAIIAIVGIGALLFFSTYDKSAQETGSTDIVTDVHNAQNSLDWPGSYFGVLPCASCPGIITLITINDNDTFDKTTEYIDSEDTPQTVRGKLTWSDDKNIIMLDDEYYRVGENELVRLDADKQPVTGVLAKEYVLTKTELAPEPDANDGYTLQQFKGDDGKSYDIVFNTNPKVPTALVSSGDLQILMVQGESWAKGAEYTGHNAKLTAGGDSAVLILGDKEIKLKSLY